MRDEEARLEGIYDRYTTQAEEAERKAILAEAEAARLEKEVKAGSAEPADAGPSEPVE